MLIATNVIGCIACIEQWHESGPSSAKCPLCRTTNTYNTNQIVRGIPELLGQRIPSPQQKSEDTTESSPQNTGQEDEDGD